MFCSAHILNATSDCMMLIRDKSVSSKKMWCISSIYQVFGYIKACIKCTFISGISTNFGESLQTQRRFVLHVLRDFGLGKSTMDDIIMEEATNLMDEFQRNVNQKYDPHFSLKKAAANIINVLAFGERRDYNDAKFVKSMQLVIDIFQAMGGGTARSFFPFLRFVPGDLFGFKQYRSDINELKSQFQGWIDQHKRMLAQGEEPTDLIGRYLIEIDKTKDDETTYFTGKSE